MRVILNFELPIEPFNSMLRDGKAGPAIQAIMEELKPEAAYFYAPSGCRGGMMVVNIDNASQIPSIAEPLFLKFNAKIDTQVVMVPEDLAKAGLDEIGKKWG